MSTPFSHHIMMVVVTVAAGSIEQAAAPSPHWNKEGILFVRVQADRSEDLYLIDPQSDRVTRLTDLKGHVKFPKWSPDGRYIAFRYDNDQDSNGNLDSLYLLNFQTNVVVELKTRMALSKPMPIWAPDSSRLAVLGSEGVEIIKTDGSSTMHATKVMPNFSGGWSEDSQEFIFQSQPGIITGLEIDSGEFKEHRLPDSVVDLSAMDFIVSSSDHAILAWDSSGRTLAKVDMGHTVIPDNNSLTMPASVDYCLLPVKSPNERYVAYFCVKKQKDQKKLLSWYIAAIQESEWRIVASGQGLHPRWSPDSDEILFVDEKNGLDHLYIYTLKSGETKPLTNGNHID